MTGFLPEVSSGDRIALLVLYTGILLVVLSAGLGIYHGDVPAAAEHLKELRTLGGSLVLAAMGVLRFKPRNDDLLPPPGRKN